MKLRKGFTIIEVTLVLGIAGVILTLAFIVLPTLTRNQRDSQRKSDIMSYADSVKKFQSNNNRGGLPNASQLYTVRDKYIGTFTDPDGVDYILSHNSCGEANTKPGVVCANIKLDEDTFNTHKIYFVVGADCGDSNLPIKSANSRKAALVYKLESNENFCYAI